MKPDVRGIFTLGHTAKQVYWLTSQYSSTHQLLQSSATCSNDVTQCTRIHHAHTKR